MNASSPFIFSSPWTLILSSHLMMNKLTFDAVSLYNPMTVAYEFQRY